MEKCKRIEAEFQLPEVIIQHIQSFLSGKEAAQTTILSKSWYGAWLTRPNLEFDRRDFKDEDVFWKFVRTIVERNGAWPVLTVTGSGYGVDSPAQSDLTFGSFNNGSRTSVAHERDPYYLHGADHPGLVLVSYPLTGGGSQGN